MAEQGGVVLEQKRCMACYGLYDTGNVLFDEPGDGIDGFGVCPEHEEILRAGMMLLIEVENDRPPEPPHKISPEEAKLTGRMIGLHRAIVQKMTGMDDPPPIAYVHLGTIPSILKTLGLNDGDFE